MNETTTNPRARTPQNLTPEHRVKGGKKSAAGAVRDGRGKFSKRMPVEAKRGGQ